MEYKIMKAKVSDAEGIAKVHIRTWHETYKGLVEDEYLKGLILGERITKWEERLVPNKKHWAFVAVDEKDKIVGFISGGRARDKKLKRFGGELYAIYILKAHQKKNIGTLLTQRLCKEFEKNRIKNMYVCVLKDNPYKSFYRKKGARLLRTEKIKIGKRMYKEEIMGWDDLVPLCK